MSGWDTKRGQVSSTLARGYGTLAGLGIVGAAALTVPSTLFLDPRPEAEAYFSTVAAMVLGLTCMALPWERIGVRWLHLVGVVAIVQAAVAVALFGQAYVAFFFLIAVAAAYMTASWKELMAQVTLIGIALFGPALWGPQEPVEALHVALVVFPLLCLTTGVFAYLRRRMVADQSSYRVFAEETLSLATRIAGHPLAAGQSFEVGSDLPSWSQNQRFSARVTATAACVLAVPLITAGLAAAGVKLPAFAADTLGEVGIELPNQGSSQDEADSGVLSGTKRAGATSTDDRSRAPAPGDEAGGDGSSKSDGAAQTDESVSGGAEGPSSLSLPMSPDSSSSSAPSPSGGEPGADSGASGDTGAGAGSGSGDLGGLLGDTVDGLDGLLGSAE